MNKLILIELNFWFKSKNFRKKVRIPVLMAMALHLAIIFCLIGSLLCSTTLRQLPFNIIPREMFLPAIFLALSLDLAAKVFLVKPSGIFTRHYALFTVQKASLVRYIQIRQLFSAADIFYFPVLALFSFRFTYPAVGAFGSVCFLVNLYLLFLINSVFASFFREKVFTSMRDSVKTIFFVILVIAVLTVYVLMNKPMFLINCFQTLFLTPVVVVILISLLKFQVASILKMLYHSDNKKEVQENNASLKNHFLNKGSLASLLTDELLLIIRNKRTSQFFAGNILLSCLALPLFHEINKTEMGTRWILGYLILLIGYSMTCYLQLSFGWQGKYFEGVLTKPVDIREFLTTKVLLFDVYCMTLFLLTIPLFIDQIHLLTLLLTALLCNLGINAYLLAAFMFFNNKSVDLNRNSILNYEGINLIQFISASLLLAIPIGFYTVFWSWFGNNQLALIGLSLICAVSVCFHNRYINLLTSFFHNKKYTILEGFKRTT